MPNICFYFHLHQPFRLSDFSVFDIGSDQVNFFADPDFDSNKQIFDKVAQKSYYPMLTLLLELLETQPKFCFSMSITGVFLEQAECYDPEIIRLLQKLVATGRLELIAETYHHSLASLYSPTEFKKQVDLHQQFLDHLFDYTPIIFRNTELIYSNDIAHLVGNLGYKGMLTEAVPRYLGDRPKTRTYWSHTDNPIPLMLKHAELSDDIAFRFSDRNWHSYPLNVDTYLKWVEVYGEEEYINLFMDFETFGEHQWADTGIFNFFRHFVHTFAEKSWNNFVTPKDVLVPLYDQQYGNNKKNQVEVLSNSKVMAEPLIQNTNLEAHQIYSVTEPISWADVDRDITAWRDSPLQVDTLNIMYDLEDKILATKNEKIIEDWRKLQTSDHFYYMCTKWSADGDVHAYFSPHKSPYEAYRKYAIALAHLQETLL